LPGGHSVPSYTANCVLIIWPYIISYTHTHLSKKYDDDPDGV
jgi:hypothetical protein